MNNRLIIAIIVGLGLGFAARADVVSYIASVPSGAGSLANFATELDLPAFNPDFGTLTGVKLDFAGELSQSAEIENLADTGAAYSVASTSVMSLSRTGSLALTFAKQMSSLGTLGAFDHSVDFAGSSGMALGQQAMFDLALTDPNTAQYIGIGSIPFFAQTLILNQFQTTSNNLVAGFSTADAVQLAVVYNFDPAGTAAIPEPPVATALIGIAALGFAIRRPRCWPHQASN